MKIYNKKTFASAVFFLALAAGLLTATRVYTMKMIVLIILCALIGGGFLIRSLSKDLSRKDKLEDLDERNRLVALKSAARAHNIAQAGSFLFTILFLGIGSGADIEQFTGIGFGAALCYTISIFAELFTKLYYDMKM